MTTEALQDPGASMPQSSVLDVLDGLLRAQRLDLSAPRSLAPGIDLIHTNDDYVHVNTYVTYEPPFGDNIDLERLRSILWEVVIEPSRTEIVVPDDLSADARAIASAVKGRVRRVVQLSEFLDEFLRPNHICDELLGESSEHFGAAGQLLSEDDFIAQAAVIPGEGKADALRHLYAGWASGASPRLCIVIAPAGHGKSKITHILAKRLARQYRTTNTSVKPPLPILISFAQYRRSTSFAGLVLSALDRFGNNRLTIEAFQYLISLGRILFILDGYDEMVEANPEMARDNVAEFVRNAGPRSRILLTARSIFYRTSSDVVGQVDDPLLAESEVEIVDLLPFDRGQAREYMRKRLGSIQGQGRVMERAQAILDNDPHLEILGSPIFLAEFVDLIASERWSIADVRKRGSLEFLIERTFDRERERQQHEFTDDEQRRYLEAIAFDLLTTDVPGYTRDDLEIFAAEAVDDEFLLSDWRKLASHHFLLPDDASDTPVATMRHQVWREYFQGSALAVRLSKGDARALRELTRRDLPEGVLKAAGSVIETAARLRLVDLLDGGTDQLVRNTLRMHLLAHELDHSGMLSLPAKLNRRLTGRDLSRMTFHRVRFEGSLAEANLTGCFFDRCDLSDVSLERALLNRTSFVSSLLPPSTANADVASVTVDGEQLFGPQIVDRYRVYGEVAEPESSETSDHSEFRSWATDIIRGRLAKFLKPRAGEALAIFDSSISWTAFMGGTDPRHRDFVVRRVYRALHAEDIVSEGSVGGARRPTVALNSDSAVRAEIAAFVRDGNVGPSIERVIARLVR